MTISITKYIDLVSSVGGGEQVPAVELIGRLYTTNNLVPTGGVLEFNSAADVGDYFGTASAEYLRAVPYFTFINKNATRAQKISYARWVDVDTAPQIFGVLNTTTLTAFNAIGDGSLTLELGGVTNILTGIDLTTAVSLTAVATAIQAAINLEVGLQWTGATVVFDALRGSFNFTGGDAVAATISTAATVAGTDLRNLIGWGDAAIFSDGSLAESLTDVLTASASTSDNFGSFVFIPALSLGEHAEVAIWNALQNVKFQYYVPVLLVDYVSYSAALGDTAMVGLVISEDPAFYPEQAPMQILASTDYSKTNAVQNFMFQQPNIPATVFDNATSNALDAARVNYMGQTQTAGQQVSFFQRGFLMGGATDPAKMNVAANEQFLRAAATAGFMNTLLALSRIPANAQGRAIGLAVLDDDVITPGLFNGSISVDKALTSTQISYITGITGDSLAWAQVQSNGYWRDVEINATTGVLSYLLVYSKDDVINKIDGVHSLI